MMAAILDDTNPALAAAQVLAEARRTRAPAVAIFHGCRMLAEPHWTEARVLEVWQYAATNPWVLLGRHLERFHARGIHAAIGTREGQWFAEIDRLGRVVDPEEAAADDLPLLSALIKEFDGLRSLLRLKEEGQP
jgi:hypothetical protein